MTEVLEESIVTTKLAEDKPAEKPKKTRGRPKKETPPKPPRVLKSIKIVDEETSKEKYRQP